MPSALEPLLTTFLIDVTFFSGDDQFAVQSYVVETSNWYRAEQQALQLSGASVYDDPRIPGLRRTAVARPV